VPVVKMRGGPACRDRLVRQNRISGTKKAPGPAAHSEHARQTAPVY